MKINKAEMEAILKTLPVGYYLGRNVSVEITDGEEAYADMLHDQIKLGIKLLEKAASALPENAPAERREFLLRCLLYHEIGHLILTPVDLKSTGMDYDLPPEIVNIFEDERLERLLGNIFYGVDFREFLRLVCGDPDPAKATNPRDKFYIAVRYRKTTPAINAQIDKIIKDYRGMTCQNDFGVCHYLGAIKALWAVFENPLANSIEQQNVNSAKQAVNSAQQKSESLNGHNRGGRGSRGTLKSVEKHAKEAQAAADKAQQAAADAKKFEPTGSEEALKDAIQAARRLLNEAQNELAKTWNSKDDRSHSDLYDKARAASIDAVRKCARMPGVKENAETAEKIAEAAQQVAAVAAELAKDERDKAQAAAERLENAKKDLAKAQEVAQEAAQKKAENGGKEEISEQTAEIQEMNSDELKRTAASIFGQYDLSSGTAESMKKLLFRISKKKAFRTGATGSYFSGKLNKKAAAMDKDKIFIRPNQDSGAKFDKIKLVLWIDSSGSFQPSEDKINTIIKALEKVEKETPNFQLEVIAMGESRLRLTYAKHVTSSESPCAIVLNKSDRKITAEYANQITEDYVKCYKQTRDNKSRVIDLVVFDGECDTYANITKAPEFQEIKKICGSIWNNRECSIISDIENKALFSAACPNAKKVFCNRGYVDILESKVMEILGKVI